MAHDVFISYSSIDKTAADTVCSVLEQNGIRCWMAPRNITPGIDFSEAIIDGIRSSKMFVLVYSSNSNNSKQVIREVDRAVDAGLPVINLRLEDVPMSKQLEYYLSSVHWLDAIKPPLEEHVNKLSGVVKIFLENDDAKVADLEKAIRDGTLKVGHGKRTIASGGKPWKKAAIAMAALGVLLVVALLIGLPRWKQKMSLETTAIGKSIAVLPFTNLSNDPDQEYFSDGMMEEILDRLFKIGDLKVISRTSSMRYRNTDKSIKEIAGELGVANILEGSVRRIGNNVRITVQLINAKTDAHLWSEIYDGDLSDLSRIFFIQSEVAQSVARELRAVLSPQEIELIKKLPTQDPEAYNLYLKGLYFFARPSPESMERALSFYQAAIDKDPNFAQAYAGIGQILGFIGVYHFAPPAEMLPKAKAALEKALSLDENLAEAHAVAASLAYWIEWDWEAAAHHFDRALALNPGDAMTHAHYSWFMVTMNRLDEAIQAIKTAQELDPLMPHHYAWSAGILNFAGRLDEALHEIARALEIDPNSGLAFHHAYISYLYMGLLDKALDALEKSKKSGFFSWGMNAAWIYLLKGDRENAERLFWEMIEQKKTIPQTSSLIIALLACDLGKLDLAFDFLDMAFEERDILMTSIQFWASRRSSIAADPRYKALLTRMKLDLIPSP